MFFGSNRRLSELEEQVRKLKNEIADRDLAWEEMRARCKRLLDRTEKQYRAMGQAEEQEPEVPLPNTKGNTTVIQASPDRMNRIRQQLAVRRQAG